MTGKDLFLKRLVLRRPKKQTTIERSEYVGCGKRMLPYFGTCNLNIHMPIATLHRPVLLQTVLQNTKKGYFLKL